MEEKNRIIHWFIIGVFVLLYFITSVVSTIHVVDFFALSNPLWLSVTLAVAFEIGAAASLASLITLDKMNKPLVWALFITLTGMQAMGNTYYAYTNLENFNGWVELFGLVDYDIIYQKRVLSIVSGAILPLVALGFIKSLVDYIKPTEEIVTEEDPQTTKEEETPIVTESNDVEDIIKRWEDSGLLDGLSETNNTDPMGITPTTQTVEENTEKKK